MIRQLEQLSNSSPDDQVIPLQFDFTGQWLLDVNPLIIKSGNYSDIQNMRYIDGGMVSCNGYTRINSTPLVTYIKGRSGIQLRTPHTVKSYVISQQFNTGLTVSKLAVNKANPPGTGDFESSFLHTDLTNAYEGNFIEGPQNNIIYCNGLETLIYGGDETQIASFMLADSITGLTPVNPIYYYEEIQNILTDGNNVVAIDAASKIYFIASTRPLSGVKIYLSAFNASASVLTVKEWTGTAWNSVGNLDDKTIVTSGTDKSHAKTGTISWDSTVDTSKPALINDELLYWYQFSLTAGTFTIYHATVNAPIQKLVNLWDGVNRICIQCQISRSGVYEDYTPEVYDQSTLQYPIAAKFSSLLNTDHVILMFTDRTTAIKFAFIASLTNKAASTLTVSYWSGSAWTSVGTVYDGTLDPGGTKSVAQSGTVYWDSPAKSSEHGQKLFGVYGYAYKFVWSNTLTADAGDPLTAGVYADTIYGIPVIDTMGTYKFAFNYKNRIFLAGDVAGKKGHIIDYGIKNAVDSFNGDDSSDNDKLMYVGDNSSDLVGAVNIFNRFGSYLYNSELLLKTNGIFILDGDDPLTFKIDQISSNYNCVAPRTICTAEIAFEIGKEAIRNIALWVSSTGPIIFDAAIIFPLTGINKYFDVNEDICVNFSALNKAHAWFDPNYVLWNVCLPSGSGQTTCNVWLTFDLAKKRWSKINTGSKQVPQATIKVVDDYGNIYFYSLTDNGYMIRLENGNLWDGTESIQGFVITNDMLPAESVFVNTTIRNVKLITEGDGTVDVTYTRSDFTIVGSGIATGNLRIYGELVEDPLCVASHWSGDNFVCKEFIEDGTPSVGNWEDIAGVVTIKDYLYENIAMTITTAAGNFISAGFLDGFLITVTGTSESGPFLCSISSTGTLTFATGKAVEFPIGTSITLTAVFIKVEHYKDSDDTPVLISFQNVVINDHYNHFKSSCNLNGLSHKFKFSFYSSALGDNVKPLLWGMRYISEREDT